MTHEPETTELLSALPIDNIRIAAYYDDHGRTTSVDVALNVDNVATADINDIVKCLRLSPEKGSTPTTPGAHERPRGTYSVPFTAERADHIPLRSISLDSNVASSRTGESGTCS